MLPGLPNQLLLIVLSTLHPRRWWKLVPTFAAATGLGALLLTIAVQSAGTRLLEAIAVDTAALREVAHGIDRYGLWILIGLSLLPNTPAQPYWPAPWPGCLPGPSRSP
ncbi:hypothetical protein [Micromonospora sp. KC213]|uniref:hypothetical protein n=1 Tax=Micromonospora sp. KC213 TaxID=2530378 RepID=UPI00104399F5|nr:hypothetical protein [Micromonospora sp. KC213]TDC40939.1 hypothetical protein E1166_13545 [Micromonospora sp. KC213]